MLSAPSIGAHAAIKALAQASPAVPETGSCGRAGKVWLQTTQGTVASLDRQRDEMVWSDVALRRLGSSAAKAEEACLEVRRARQFL